MSSMMAKKRQDVLFLALLGICVLLIFIVAAPARNYIPIIWGFLGFGVHSVLFIKTSWDLSAFLIDDHSRELERLKISYHKSRFKKEVNLFDLFQEREKIELISPQVKSQLSLFRHRFKLAAISFPMIIALALLTIFF